METDLLKNFLVLAETKNFTKAAEKLFCSQSALSLQIKRLELLIGKSLFIRDKRNVQLTYEGEELIAYSKQLIHIEKNLLTHFHESPIQGEVSFGIPEDLATTYLPDILVNFVRHYPEIALHVECQFSINLIKEFDLKNYDLVLIKQDPNRPHPKSEEVWKESLAWVSAKDSMICNLKSAPLPLILAPSPCVYRQRAIDTLNENRIVWRMIYTSPSLAGTLALVKSGLGISVLPLSMVPKDLQIVSHLPPLKDTQIALLKQDTPSKGANALARYIIENII